VATGTYTELARLYAQAENLLGGRYLPEAVLAQTSSGRWLPALTYIAATLSGNHANENAVIQSSPAQDRLLKRAPGFDGIRNQTRYRIFEVCTLIRLL
jgi:hypothetical protein